MFHSSFVVLVAIFLVFDQVSCQIKFDWLLTGSNQEEQAAKRNDAKNKVKFLLLNPRDGSFVEWKDGSFPKGLWENNHPVKVLLHSYSSDMLKSAADILAMQKISNIAYAYGNGTEKVNVVIVDWTPLAVEVEMKYKFVVGSVATAGRAVAEFILKLVKTKHLENVQSVHIVGFGVGAHVGGAAGKEISEKDWGKLGRITGLDPMGVGFDDESGQKAKNKTLSLERHDAEFVDVIHCNLGMSKNYYDAKWKGRYGSAVQAGHIDFYPNGGSEQKGCNKLADIIVKECHSKKCVEYFVRSIEGEKYVGCPCRDFDDFEQGHCNCTLEDGGHLMGEPSKKGDESKVKHYLSIDGTGKSKKRPTAAKQKADENAKKEKKAGKKKSDKKEATEKKTKGVAEKKGKKVIIKKPTKAGDKEVNNTVVEEKEPEEEEKNSEEAGLNENEPASVSNEGIEDVNPEEKDEEVEREEEKEPGETDDWGS